MGVFTRVDDRPAFNPNGVQTSASNTPRSLVGAATRIRVADRTAIETFRRNSAQDSEWQTRAWTGYECVDQETEILTTEGWVTHDQLRPGMFVRALDHAVGTTSWEPVLDVHRYDVADEPMLELTLKHHSSLTTMGHRWPTLAMQYESMRRARFDRRWETSGNLRSESKIITAAPASDLPTEAKYSDAFVELVAWFWTEGHIRQNRANKNVAITQSNRANPTYVADIRRALTSLFGTPPATSGHARRGVATWREDPKRDDECTTFVLTNAASAELLAVAPNKVVTRDFLSSLTLSQLLLFLDVSMRADGYVEKRHITQKSKERLEAYEFACILAGRTPHTYYLECSGQWHLQDLPKQTVMPRRSSSRKMVQYTGVVWCPETPSKTWLARRHGKVFYTGNSTGEIHFAFNLVGNVISRIRFYPAADVSANVAPAYVDDVADLTPGMAEAAKAAMRRISDSHGDFSTLARHLAINLSVPGEAYLVQIPERKLLTAYGVEDIPESWEIRSKEEMIVSTDSNVAIRVRSRPGDREADYITLPREAFVARIWRRNPRFSGLSDSSMRPILDTIDELNLINQTFQATARSRLNSGVFFVPDGLSASSPSTFQAVDDGGNVLPPTEEMTPADIDEFEEQLLEGMMTPIMDPSSASAVVPILVRGPAELGEKIRLIQFERTFDPSLVQRADRLLDRILAGLDLPKDIVSGLTNVRYSNAMVIEESLWRAHIEPLTLLICDALTDVYLRPALIATGYTREQAARCRVWYDPSEVVARPNRNQDAVQAYDRYQLSGRSLREAMGFNEADAPPPAELILRMLLQKGPITPDMAEALMRAFAPLAMASAQSAAQASSENPLPPEVQQLLQGGTISPTEQAKDEEQVISGPAKPAEPAPAAEPAPPADNVRGPRGGRAAETPIGDGISLLPPTPREPRGPQQ